MSKELTETDIISMATAKFKEVNSREPTRHEMRHTARMMGLPKISKTPEELEKEKAQRMIKHVPRVCTIIRTMTNAVVTIPETVNVRIVKDKPDTKEVKKLINCQEKTVTIDLRDRDMIDGKVSIFKFLTDHADKPIDASLLDDLKSCLCYVMGSGLYYVRDDTSTYRYCTTQNLKIMMSPY